jgi:hypothetical protein
MIRRVVIASLVAFVGLMSPAVGPSVRRRPTAHG